MGNFEIFGGFFKTLWSFESLVGKTKFRGALWKMPKVLEVLVKFTLKQSSCSNLST